MTAVPATNSRALWYLTRGFGLVALILLTVTMVLGLTEAVRYARPGWPRFVVSALHRNASLLAVVALTIHMVTSVLDTYAPIHLADVFLPFVSAYRPFWLGLGALALDLLLALVITSLLRERSGHRAWRAVHWMAFACWPVAVIHGLGTGSDTRIGWVQLLYVGCVVAVILSVWWRLGRGWSAANAGERGVALAASVLLPLAAAAWTDHRPAEPAGPKKSGTPTALVGVPHRSLDRQRVGRSHQIPAGWAVPFTSDFHGTQHQTGPDGRGGFRDHCRDVTGSKAAGFPSSSPASPTRRRSGSERQPGHPRPARRPVRISGAGEPLAGYDAGGRRDRRLGPLVDRHRRAATRPREQHRDRDRCGGRMSPAGRPGSPL